MGLTLKIFGTPFHPLVIPGFRFGEDGYVQTTREIVGATRTIAEGQGDVPVGLRGGNFRARGPGVSEIPDLPGMELIQHPSIHPPIQWEQGKWS